MNFDFDTASHEAQHIARFMDMAQNCLQEIQPVPAGANLRADRKRADKAAGQRGGHASMNPQSEYERALQGVLAMLPKLSVDGLWFMRGQLDAIVSHPRFIKGAVNNIIPFPNGRHPLNTAGTKEGI